MSMQEYLRGELERLIARPTIETWLEHVRQRKRLTGRRLPRKTILAHRDADRK